LVEDPTNAETSALDWVRIEPLGDDGDVAAGDGDVVMADGDAGGGGGGGGAAGNADDNDDDDEQPGPVARRAVPVPGFALFDFRTLQSPIVLALRAAEAARAAANLFPTPSNTGMVICLGCAGCVTSNKMERYLLTTLPS
jgi:hypothetical protein